MSFSEAMREIESYTFAARMNVASDFRTFQRGARHHECVKLLLKETESFEILDRIVRRLFELSKEKIDLRYENPWDTALTIYLWIISLRDANLAKALAEVVIQAPQCWWGPKLARHIILEKQLQNDAGNFGQQLFGSTSSKPIQVRTVSNAGDAILYSGLIMEMHDLSSIIHAPANIKTTTSKASQHESSEQPPEFRVVADSNVSNRVPA